MLKSRKRFEAHVIDRGGTTADGGDRAKGRRRGTVYESRLDRIQNHRSSAFRRGKVLLPPVFVRGRKGPRTLGTKIAGVGVKGGGTRESNARKRHRT